MRNKFYFLCLICFFCSLISGTVFAEEFFENAIGQWWKNGDWVLTHEFSDSDNNGTINSVYTCNYDSNGNRISKKYDSDNNGTVDNAYSYSYDSNGNMTKIEYDSNNDGIIDDIINNTYDVDGNRTKEEYDSNNDGTFNKVINHTYDSNGNMTKTEINDVFSDSVYTYTYDSNGNLTNSTSRIIDTFDFATFDSDPTLILGNYDSDPTLIEGNYDSGNFEPGGLHIYLNKKNMITKKKDGTVDYVSTYTYDSNGNVITIEIDNTGNSQLHLFFDYTYDLNGNKVKEIGTYDDGTMFHITTFSYDSNGNKTKEEYDDGADGTIDFVSTYTWKNLSSSSSSDGVGCFIGMLF